MIVKLYKYIKRLFSYKTEEQRVAAALYRYKNELYNLNADFDPTTDCCQDINYYPYEEHYEKI
jgi:hypothetical protein